MIFQPSLPLLIFLEQGRIISSKKLERMARKWKKVTAAGRKRISFRRTNGNMKTKASETSSKADDEGHFVVYTTDRRRFVIPLAHLNNEVFIELFRRSEEEFGLPGNGPIILPCDASFLEYIVLLIGRRMAKNVQNALLMASATSQCSSLMFNHGTTDKQLIICGQWLPATFHPPFKTGRMIISKKLARMARKWKKEAAAGRKRISFRRTNDNMKTKASKTSLKADDGGHFVVYTTDRRRFAIPLAHLNNEVFIELFRRSGEEFGLPGNGPIILPCDAYFLEYIVLLIGSCMAKNVENALLAASATSHCSSLMFNHGRTERQLVVLHIDSVFHGMEETSLLKGGAADPLLPPFVLGSNVGGSNIIKNMINCTMKAKACKASTKADGGQFVVYTADRRCFAIPLAHLNNEVFIELFRRSEEEFGLPGNGPIVWPCEASFLEYIVSLIGRLMAKNVENAQRMASTVSWCSTLMFDHEKTKKQ
ncbi:Small auxin-up RNA [Dillenia turbinata]|uniref:Small auxin-up RNA n=1 Tax=Dillenia turbinata TaxID=194707 RepID=A0AAN8WI66_9MAGN